MTKIAIINNFPKKWIAGTYYLHNIISSFKYLEKENRPMIYYLASDKYFYKEIKKYSKELNIKFNSLESTYILARGLRKIKKKLKIKQKYPKIYSEMNCFFPNPPEYIANNYHNPIYWIADFQEKYLPEFFSEDEIKGRHEIYKRITSTKSTVVVSSNDALEDLKKFYPDYHCNPKVLQFSVIHSNINYIDQIELKKKYGLSKDYFIICNQFWEHKDHETAINAFLEIKKKYNIDLICTGELHDYRNSSYIKKIKNIINDSDIKITGFISRNDQLSLIKHSLALIQPSLFEGWSTVIEDGKAINKFIIAADLDVNKEQLLEYPNKVFFKKKIMLI